MGVGRCCAVCLYVALLAGLAAASLALFYLQEKRDATSRARVFVSGMSLSSFDVTPSSGQLNGTWHIDFSLLHKGPKVKCFPCGSAAVSVRYKGTYLAGVNLHAFRVPGVPVNHLIPLEAKVDASRSDVPGWLARDLMEARTLGVVEFEVQFVTKYYTWHNTYLCRSLKLGF